jgi:hypothetical protein
MFNVDLPVDDALLLGTTGTNVMRCPMNRDECVILLPKEKQPTVFVMMTAKTSNTAILSEIFIFVVVVAFRVVFVCDSLLLLLLTTHYTFRLSVLPI